MPRSAADMAPVAEIAPSNCWPYLRLVERLLEQHRPGVVLDIGCGDGRVAANIQWGSVRYIGIDVTDEPLELHRGRQVPGSRIYRADALRDVLPEADLVLTKEATQHMDIASVLMLMDRLRHYKRIIHTSVVQGIANSDIIPGECRGIDLTLPPFELPAQTILRFRSDSLHRFSFRR